MAQSISFQIADQRTCAAFVIDARSMQNISEISAAVLCDQFAYSFAAWRMLNKLGVETLVCRSENRLLAVGRSHEPQLIIVDLDMRQLSGTELCARIRAEIWGQRALVVAVAATADVLAREDTRASAFDVRILKGAEMPVWREVTGMLCRH
jgi:CheY-like chemotaxis protein